MKWLLVILLMQATAVSSATHKNVVTTEDVCLSHVIVREAQAEGLVGMRAVYDAVKTRASRRNLSVCETVKQKFQFSSIKAGEKLKYDEKLLTVLREVRKMSSVVKGADFFYASWGRKPAWSKKFKLVAIVKNHRFYSSV